MFVSTPLLPSLATSTQSIYTLLPNCTCFFSVMLLGDPSESCLSGLIYPPFKTISIHVNRHPSVSICLCNRKPHWKSTESLSLVESHLFTLWSHITCHSSWSCSSSDVSLRWSTPIEVDDPRVSIHLCNWKSHWKSRVPVVSRVSPIHFLCTSNHTSHSSILQQLRQV